MITPEFIHFLVSHFDFICPVAWIIGAVTCFSSLMESCLYLIQIISFTQVRAIWMWRVASHIWFSPCPLFCVWMWLVMCATSRCLRCLCFCWFCLDASLWPVTYSAADCMLLFYAGNSWHSMRQKFFYAFGKDTRRNLIRLKEEHQAWGRIKTWRCHAWLFFLWVAW